MIWGVKIRWYGFSTNQAIDLDSIFEMCAHAKSSPRAGFAGTCVATLCDS
jgi:hypothetical protein